MDWIKLDWIHSIPQLFAALPTPFKIEANVSIYSIEVKHVAFPWNKLSVGKRFHYIYFINEPHNFLSLTTTMQFLAPGVPTSTCFSQGKNIRSIYSSYMSVVFIWRHFCACYILVWMNCFLMIYQCYDSLTHSLVFVVHRTTRTRNKSKSMLTSMSFFMEFSYILNLKILLKIVLLQNTMRWYIIYCINKKWITMENF